MSAEDNSEVGPATPESDQVEADAVTEDTDQTEDEPAGARRGSGFWALLAAVLLVAIILLILLTQCVPRVPDVVGLSQKQATIKLEDSGYELGEVSKVELPDTSPGKVAEQAPPAGAVFGRGKSVDLIVALGADLTKVPDVIGNDTPAAQLLITGQDLVMEITGAYSDTIVAGAIISQSPPPGAEVPVGSAVVVVVSLGAAPDSGTDTGTSGDGGTSAAIGTGGTGSSTTGRSNCTAVYKNASVWSSGGDIYIRLTPGGGTRRLTSGSAWDTGPILAPSGKYVVFMRAPSSGKKPTGIGRVCLTDFDVVMLDLPVSRPTTADQVHYGTPIFAPSPTGTEPGSDWLVIPQYWPPDPETSIYSARLLITNVPIASTWVSWNVFYRDTPGLVLSRSNQPGSVKVTQPGVTGPWAVRNFNVYTGRYSKP